MSVYLVAQLKIEDRERYQLYESAFLPVFQQFDGEILAVDESPAVAEGEWPYTRIVILRFPDREAATAWYQSDGYQAIVGHRLAAAEGPILVVNGFDPAALG